MSDFELLTARVAILEQVVSALLNNMAANDRNTAMFYEQLLTNAHEAVNTINGKEENDTEVPQETSNGKGDPSTEGG